MSKKRVPDKKQQTSKSEPKKSVPLQQKQPSISLRKTTEKVEFEEVDLDLLEADEALVELFEKLNPLTIPSVILGIILLVITYTTLLDNYPIALIVIGFVGGLSFVFGCSELLIFGVKGIGRKLDWSEYFMGIMASIGANTSDLVVVGILLLKARSLPPEDSELANSLTLTSITFILTTVLINTLILGVTMIVVAREKPFKLPNELTHTESNVVLAMTIFSFFLFSFGIAHNAIGIEQFNRAFQGIIGAALLIFYLMFILFLIGDAKEKRTVKIGPQMYISEFFPEEEDEEENEIESSDEMEENGKKPRVFSKIIGFFKRDNDKEDREQYIALRRFPWIVILIVFIIGVLGIVFGGDMISDSIEQGLVIFNLPILVYCVVIGFVSSAPEATVTFRALLDPEEEGTEIGLVNQVSSINHTFFLLFGFAFLFSSILNIYIPVEFDTTLVLAGIFAISMGLHLTIVDDNHFDRVEGMLILVVSITSLAALAIVGVIL